MAATKKASKPKRGTPQFLQARERERARAKSMDTVTPGRDRYHERKVVVRHHVEDMQETYGKPKARPAAKSAAKPAAKRAYGKAHKAPASKGKQS